MNIIVATHDSLHPIKGGGALRTLKVAEELKKRGHNVIIIAPADATLEINGMTIEWLHAPCKQRSQLLSSIKFNIRLLVKYLKFIRWSDMFFIHNTVAAATLLLLKPFYKFKFSLDITDIHAEYILIGERTVLETLVTPLLLFVEYRIIKLADNIIVASQAMKKVLIEHGVNSNKIDVVYDGAETDKISTDKHHAYNFNIIHLGLTDKQHGVDILIQALPAVIKAFPCLKCFIVGDGRELANIMNLAKKLGVYDNCVFTGQLSCHEAREYLKMANLGIIPRRDNLPNRIVTTLKLLEYWSSGTCVVSSKLEAITEIASDNVNIIYFEPGNSADLADKIKKLLSSSPERLELLRKNGICTAHKYSWDTLIPKIADKAVR